MRRGFLSGCRSAPQFCTQCFFMWVPIYTLSKLRWYAAVFHLLPLSFQIFFVPLQCFRIVGNAEVRPMNVKADAQANGGNDGEILVTAFLFNIIEQRLTAYLTYCRLFVLRGSLRRIPQYNLITLCYER